MATLLDQFKSAVDMMHTGVPQTYSVPYSQPVAQSQAPLAPVVPMAPQYVQPVSTAYQPLGAKPKSGNFLSKNWPIVLGVGIVLVSLVIVVSIVIKKKTGSKSKRRTGGDDDDDDDDDSLKPHIPRVHPQFQQQQQQQQQQPTQYPKVLPVATTIPLQPILSESASRQQDTSDPRYTDTPIRGGLMPTNTRGAEGNLQPTPGVMSNMFTQQQQQSQILPLPPPTTNANGIPLQPQQVQQTPPSGLNPVVANVASTIPTDPNFTRL